MTKISDLKALLAAGRITRRQFMEGAIALGVAATTAPLLIKEAFADTPKRGGHLKLALAGGHTTDSLDGATLGDTFAIMLTMGGTFDALTEVAADGSLKGELAESWEASDDAKEWTFKLRKGVEFHNGKPFGADDVIATINHHLDDASKSSAKPIVKPIESMKKDDEHTIIFTLQEGNADFPYLLSDYHLMIMPAGQFAESIAKGIGTGGYVLESFDPGVSAMVKRNPNDYRDDRSWFDSFEIIGANDVVARTNALTTGEVHAINRVDLKTEHLLKRAPNVDIFEVTGNQHFTFPMLTDVAPYDNNDVRLALKYSVDRDELVQKVLSGHGSVGNDTPIGAANRYRADIPQRTYDPDKARFHLKKAGLDSLDTVLTVSDGAFPGAVDAGALYKEHAAKAGINITLERVPGDGYWENVWRVKPWCACYWSGRPTEDWMFSTAYEAGADWNDTHFDNARFDELLLQARAELNEERRAQMYAEMQQILHDEGGVVIPMFANYVDAASSELAHGPVIGNAWQMDGSRLTERWWFA
ncbi:MAG: ABC transporter substrate-binding protein [Pseudomonadota bacterium]